MTKPAVVMPEKDFQRSIIELAHLHGWLVAHFRTSMNRGGRYQTAVAADGAGWPDLTLVRERVMFAELKTDVGKLSDAQQAWHDALQAAGAEVHVWRPRDLEAINHTLRTRRQEAA